LVFLETFCFFSDFFCGKIFASLLLILAALFLCMMWFLAARSEREIAVRTSFSFLPFFATRMAISNLVFISLFIASFLVELLSALFAVFVTGI